MTRVDAMAFALTGSDLLRARAAAGAFDLHLHSTYSVVALRSGAAEVRSRRWSGPVRAGDVVVVGPFDVHSVRSAREPAGYEVLYPSREFVGAVVPTQVVPTQLVSPRAESRDLVEVLSAPGAGAASIEACLTALLRTCAVDPAPPADGAVALAARALIEANGTRVLRTADLAREVGVHASHLARAFKNATGVAPQTYARQVRVARARELICAGRGLSEVAQLLGFSDQPHLTREFKKVHGVPPGALARGIGAHLVQDPPSGPA